KRIKTRAEYSALKYGSLAVGRRIHYSHFRFPLDDLQHAETVVGLSVPKPQPALGARKIDGINYIIINPLELQIPSGSKTNKCVDVLVIQSDIFMIVPG